MSQETLGRIPGSGKKLGHDILVRNALASGQFCFRLPDVPDDLVVLPRFSGQLSTAVESVCILLPLSTGCQEAPLLAAE